MSSEKIPTFDDAISFHGHACPGLALGYRAAEYALRKLGGRAEDEELVALVENDTCAVDAIQVLTGCTFGKGNLFFLDHGKQVYTFIKRSSIRNRKAETLRLSVEWVAPEESAEEEEAWKRYADGDRSEEVLGVVHERKSRKMKAILEAPDVELFRVSSPEAEPPAEAHIYQSVRCERCGEKTMETRLRLLGGRKYCLPCFGRIEKGEA